ncbi:sulfotransferase family protein [Pseudodesulfovibrio sp.]|uniref:sulfotransferase family protein n=1 Tax=unclassified Pseudodesulfovibrio TaxID=2661612 RepID=UPI003B002095
MFFPIGFQRSGTTLLNYLLNEHPAIVSYSEWELVYWIHTGNERLLIDPQADSYVKILRDHPIDSEAYSLLAWAYIKGELSIVDFVRRSYMLGVRETTQVVGNKEAISLTHCQYGVMKKFAKDFRTLGPVIFIERDPRAVTASFIKLGFYPPDKAPLNEANLKQFVIDYVNCMNASEKYIRRFRRILPIRYEDLLSNPVDVLQRIFSFLEVDDSRELAHSICTTSGQRSRMNFTGIAPERAMSWEKRLSTSEAGWIMDYYGSHRKTKLFS